MEIRNLRKKCRSCSLQRGINKRQWDLRGLLFEEDQHRKISGKRLSTRSTSHQPSRASPDPSTGFTLTSSDQLSLVSRRLNVFKCEASRRPQTWKSGIKIKIPRRECEREAAMK